METEEFEQIPWASLVAQQDEGVDKRIYLAVGLVGVLAIAIFGMRILGGGAQPLPPQAEAPVQTPTEQVVTAPAETSSTSVVIAEADLRAEEPSEMAPHDHLTEATAEWFVIDWFTRDGSAETIRSVTERLAPSVAVASLPHDDASVVTFVEWAKAVAMDATSNGVEVKVAYRVIRETEEGFVRDPVRTVVVELERDGENVSVVALPNS